MMQLKIILQNWSDYTFCWWQVYKEIAAKELESYYAKKRTYVPQPEFSPELVDHVDLAERNSEMPIQEVDTRKVIENWKSYGSKDKPNLTDIVFESGEFVNEWNKDKDNKIEEAPKQLKLVEVKPPSTQKPLPFLQDIILDGELLEDWK